MRKLFEENKKVVGSETLVTSQGAVSSVVCAYLNQGFLNEATGVCTCCTHARTHTHTDRFTDSALETSGEYQGFAVTVAFLVTVVETWH